MRLQSRHHRTKRALAWIAVGWLVGGLVAGCDRQADSGDGQELSGQAGGAGAAQTNDGATPDRIVCLVPAVTQMLVDLDLEDRLVGVGQPDPAAPAGVARMGNYLNVDAEALIGAKPDLVITLVSKDSPSPRLIKLARQSDFKLAAYPNPSTLDDVARTLALAGKAEPKPTASREQAKANRDSDRKAKATATPRAKATSTATPEANRTNTPPLGRLLGMADQARALREKFESRLKAIGQRYADDSTPRVLLCLGTTPVMACGPGTVHAQVLELINAKNAAANAAVTAPTYDRESIVSLKPDVIVLLEPAARKLTPDDPRLAEFRGLPVPAVTHHRIKLINDPKCLLPTTTLPQIAKRMGEAVHGKGSGS